MTAPTNERRAVIVRLSEVDQLPPDYGEQHADMWARQLPPAELAAYQAAKAAHFLVSTRDATARAFRVWCQATRQPLVVMRPGPKYARVEMNVWHLDPPRLHPAAALEVKAVFARHGVRGRPYGVGTYTFGTVTQAAAEAVAAALYHIAVKPRNWNGVPRVPTGGQPDLPAEGP
jgi:hypothetical protein